MSAERPLRDGREASFSLIETMRWEPRTGFLRGDLHLARLAGSAQALGFAYLQKDAETQLNAALKGYDTAMRVRLELSSDGSINITTQPFSPLQPGTIWQLRISASAHLVSSDPLLAHKTSRREVYERAQQEFLSSKADEVLLLNEKGHICEGTITSLFIEDQDGTLLTPALSSGLLDGVLRREMLMAGKVREAILSPADLTQARRVFVGNSLRGLILAELNSDAL